MLCQLYFQYVPKAKYSTSDRVKPSYQHLHKIVCSILFYFSACFVACNFLPVVGELEATRRDVVTSQRKSKQSQLNVVGETADV